MVKRLYSYKDKTIYIAYGDSNNKFRSQLVIEKDNHGNNIYYVRTPQGKERIYSRGKKRVSMQDNVLVLNQDRRWAGLVRLMDSLDREMKIKL
jgi:hypothetical protein